MFAQYRKYSARLILGAVSLGVSSAPLFAQDAPIPLERVSTTDDRPPSAFEKRMSGSLVVSHMRPVGELRRNIGVGYGVTGTGMFKVDKQGILSIRGDAGFLGYGSETKRVPLSPTIGGRITVDVRTGNDVAFGTIGPQITLPTRFIQPYVNAGIGFNVFFTESSVEGTDSDWEFANTTNHSDFTSTWTTGGGVYIPVYSGRKTNLMLDLGVTYFGGGHATYLKPGSIRDLPNGQIELQTLESKTEFMMVRVGVKIGM